MRKPLFAIISAVSIINVVLLVWLISVVRFQQYGTDTDAYRDSLKAAMELGRLDFVTAVLSALAIVVVFGGMFAWITFEARAEKEARAEAKKRVEELLPEMLPGLVAKHMALLAGGDADIAGHVDADDMESDDGQIGN